MAAKKKTKIAAPKRPAAKRTVVAGADKWSPATALVDYRALPLWERVAMWAVLAVIVTGVFFWH